MSRTTKRQSAAVRYDCMDWAMRTAAPGDDAMAIVARAQLFAEFVLGSASPKGVFVRRGADNVAIERH